MVESCNTLAELDEAIEQAGNKLVVIDFCASDESFGMGDFFATDDEGQNSCQTLCPELEQLASQEKDVVFLRVDITQNQEALEAKYYNLPSCIVPLYILPALIFIKGGVMIELFTSAKLDWQTIIKDAINKHKKVLKSEKVKED